MFKEIAEGNNRNKDRKRCNDKVKRGAERKGRGVGGEEPGAIARVPVSSCYPQVLPREHNSYLGASHPNLGPCVDVDATVGFAGDGAAHGVGDPHGQRTAILTVPQRQECVCSLT